MALKRTTQIGPLDKLTLSGALEGAFLQRTDHIGHFVRSFSLLLLLLEGVLVLASPFRLCQCSEEDG